MVAAQGKVSVDLGGSDRCKIDNIDDFGRSRNRRKSLILNGRGREDSNLRPPGPEPDSAVCRELLNLRDRNGFRLNALRPRC